MIITGAPSENILERLLINQSRFEEGRVSQVRPFGIFSSYSAPEVPQNQQSKSKGQLYFYVFHFWGISTEAKKLVFLFTWTGF